MAIRLLDETDRTELEAMIEASVGSGNEVVTGIATGQIVHVEDAEAVAIKSLKFYDSADNEITDTVNLAIANKNLFRIDLLGNSVTSNGITFKKNSDGSITATGTSTATYPSTKCTMNKNAFVVGKTYTVSSGKTSGYLYVQLIINYTDGTTDYIVSRNTPSTFKINKAVSSITGSVQITDKGVTFTETIYPQVEVASTSSAFANNIYKQVSFDGSSMPVLPDTISNVWVNNDTIKNIEMEYVQLVGKALYNEQQSQEQTASELEQLKSSLFDMFYPVGSIYTSTESTSPETLFGGTWEQIKDTFLLASGSAYAAGTTGGEEQHTLTINEMPTHNHSYDNAMYSEQSSFYGHVESADDPAIPVKSGVDYTGGGKPHNNMPPYLAVYMWKRTA